MPAERRCTDLNRGQGRKIRTRASRSSVSSGFADASDDLTVAKVLSQGGCGLQTTISAPRQPWAPNRHPGRYCVPVAPSIDFTIAFDEPDEDGWIVARVLEVSGALSQGRTREEARENALDALRTVLTPDDELSGRRSGEDLEHLRFVVAA